MSIEKINFRQEKKIISLDFQGLKNQIEKIERPTEKLVFLIKQFDAVLFPENTLATKISEEKDEEGGTASLGRYRDKDNQKEYWRYDINLGMDDGKEEKFEDLLGIAIHEARHRIVRKERIISNIISNIDDLLVVTESLPSLEGYRKKIEEFEEKRKNCQELNEDNLPEHIKKEEFDARIIEMVGKEAMKELGLDVQVVCEEIIRVDTKKALENVNRLLMR